MLGLIWKKETTSLKNLLFYSAGKQARYRCAFYAVVVFLSPLLLPRGARPARLVFLLALQAEGQRAHVCHDGALKYVLL